VDEDEAAARRAVIVAVLEDQLGRDLEPDDYRAVDATLEQIDSVAAQMGTSPQYTLDAFLEALEHST
jgi:hypothetical protein